MDDVSSRTFAAFLFSSLGRSLLALLAALRELLGRLGDSFLPRSVFETLFETRPWFHDEILVVNACGGHSVITDG